jgi:uncharacterized protein YyaL (SSP411 family)
VGSELGDTSMVDHSLHSLESMIRGGIYDQLGGGLHRYSTDREWLVPHFEKMLYDNALFSKACLEAWQQSKRPIFARALRETLGYVLREMTSAEGPFFSTQDADSEGREGKFFVWSIDQIEAVLGAQEAEAFSAVYGATRSGNWEGVNILRVPSAEFGEFVNPARVPVDPAEPFTDARRRLFDRREQRPKPARDEKVLTAWNGMMIDALSSAAVVFDEEDYLNVGIKASEWLLANMRGSGGRLLRTALPGSGLQAKLLAYLEDYAWLANGLISLYEASFEGKWLDEAIRLMDETITLFWDEQSGGFFFTGSDHESLISRSKTPYDDATPSGNAVAAMALARLFALTGEPRFADRLDRLFHAFGGAVVERPTAAAQLLLALRFHLGPTIGVALIGDSTHPAMGEMLRVLHQRFLPNKVSAMRRTDRPTGSQQEIALLQGKPLGAKPRAYVCRNFTCLEPVESAEDLSRLLNS